MSSNRRWLIIHPEGNALDNPTLKAFIDHCLKSNIHLDILGRRLYANYPIIEGLRWLFWSDLWFKFKQSCFHRFPSMFLYKMILQFEKRFKFRYDIIIGVDREGIIDASIISEVTDTPCVFFSFEIKFESETNYFHKQIERAACRRVSLWLVQDTQRMNCLTKENSLDEKSAILCPLGSAGLPRQNKYRMRDVLKIPTNKKVAIFIGSLTDWSMIKPILKSAICWPDDWVLLLNERYGKAQQILHEIYGNDYTTSKFYVNSEPFENVDEMPNLFAGIDVGLALYSPNYSSASDGYNLEYLGYASGKIATYVRHSVPVIMSKHGHYYIDNELYHFGRAIVTPEEIGSILATENFSHMRQNAQKYFLNKLDANLYMPNLLQKIIALAP